MAVRVLIVDDHEGFRRTARAVVEETAGFAVAGEAADGETSIAAATTLEPDVVLMDVNLPGIGGVEATRRITAAFPRMRVLLLSSRDASDFIDVAAACGAAGYLHKAQLSSQQLQRLWAGNGSNG